MINILYIVLKSFKKHFFRNIIAMIFVMLSVMMMNISFSHYMNEIYLNNLVKSSGLEGFYYISPISKSYADKTKTVNYITEKVEEMKAKGEIEGCYYLENGNAPIKHGSAAERANFVFCGSDLLMDIKYPLSKGTWFDEYDNKNSGLVPVAISYDLSYKFKIGEEFDLLGKRYVIIGVLERNSQVLTSGAGGTGLNLSSVFDNSANTVIVCGDGPFNMVDNIIVKGGLSGGENFDALNNIAHVVSFDELSKRYSEDNKELLTMQTTIFMLMLLVGIISTSSNNFLLSIINRKKYSVYYLCGMEWKTAAVISFVEAAVKLIIPAIAGYILFLIYCGQNQYNALMINGANILFTVVFLIVMFLLTSLKPLLDISRVSPVKIISEV